MKTWRRWLERHPDAMALGALLGFVSLIFSPYLVGWPPPLIYPVSTLGTDLPREVWPLARYVLTHLTADGSLPLWRSYLLSGAPLIGHPVAPVLYLPN